MTLAVLILVFAVLGALEFDGAPLALFDLDGEGKPPALFASLIDVASAGGAVALHAALRRRRWLLLGWFLLYMGADDLLTIHEHLQTLTGVQWQVIYLPLFALGGAVGLLALLDLRRLAPRSAALMVTGGAAWALAQLCEQLEYSDGLMVDGYGALATIEESLEMAGSSLFVLAFLVALRRLAATRGAGAATG